MNKKGFTLIELLAVIVILAVIALIATPMILGVIETARESAAEASATGYIDAVEKQVMVNMLDSNATQITDGVYDLPMSGISVKGDVPEEGWVVIEKGEITNYSMKIMDYIVTKGEEVTNEGTVATKPAGGSSEVTYASYSIGDYVTLQDGTSWVVIKSSSSEEVNVTIMSNSYIKNGTNLGENTGVDMFTTDSSLTTTTWHTGNSRPAGFYASTLATFISTVKTRLEASLSISLSSVYIISSSILTEMGCTSSSCDITVEPYNKIFTSENTNIWTSDYNGLQSKYMSNTGSLIDTYVYQNYSVRPIIEISKALITN